MKVRPMLKDAFHTLRSAQRPVLIFGAGVRLADAAGEARELACLLGIPVAVTWAARDMFPTLYDGYQASLGAARDALNAWGATQPINIEENAPLARAGRLAAGPEVLCVGGFGTHGTRAANFAVQNADWILSVGSRLDSKATGMPRKYFARGAHIFMVDIDPAEIAKFKEKLGHIFMGAQADAKLFLHDAMKLVRGENDWPDFGPWRARCADWLTRYPVCRPEYEAEEGINPYVLAKKLSEHCRPGEVIVSDTGLSLAWMMQGFEFKEGQRFIHAFNQTPMGYGLPAAIGAAYARPGQRIVLVSGDGGFMLNIQELALLVHHRLPIKIILINNDGHAMCRQTQEQWLGGKYYSTSVEGGLAFPDFVAVARAHGLRASSLELRMDADRELDYFFMSDDPALLEVRIAGTHRLVPQVQYGRPNEDGNPPLPREELVAQMIVGMIESN